MLLSEFPKLLKKCKIEQKNFYQTLPPTLKLTSNLFLDPYKVQGSHRFTPMMSVTLQIDMCCHGQSC